MKKLLFLLLFPLLAFAQTRTGPPTLTYRQGNSNTLDMLLTTGGAIITPSASVSVTAEIRLSEVGRIIASVPLTVADPTTGAITGTLPALQAGAYYLGLYINYAGGEPDFRVGVAHIEIVPTGSLASVVDATGLNVQITQTKQILDSRLDNTPSSGIVAYYAAQVRANTAVVISSVNSATGAAQSATAQAAIAQSATNQASAFATGAGSSASSAASSAATATTQAGIATTQAGIAATLLATNLNYTDSTLFVRKLVGYRLLSPAEITKLAATSGVNTGDETVATLKTKLGITTLSGVNTGDQDFSGKLDVSAYNTGVTAQSATDGAQNVSISGKLPASYSVTQGTFDAAQSTSIAANTTQITANGASITGLTNATAILNSTVSTHTTQIASISANVGTTNSNVTTLSATVGTNTTQIAGNTTAITGKANTVHTHTPPNITGGTVGQVLTSDGTGGTWAAASGGASTTINATSGTITAAVSISTGAPISTTGTVTASSVAINQTSTLNSGTDTGINLIKTVNGSNTAGSVGIKANLTYNSVGSGANNLLQLQNGGSDKFLISSVGSTTMGSSLLLASGATIAATTVGSLTGSAGVNAVVSGITISTSAVASANYQFVNSVYIPNGNNSNGGFNLAENNTLRVDGYTRLDYLIVKNIRPLMGTTSWDFSDTGNNTVGKVNGASLMWGADTYASTTPVIFSVGSTTKGSAPFPRMTNIQRDAIGSPTEGLFIYSLTDHAVEFFNGTTWKTITNN